MDATTASMRNIIIPMLLLLFLLSKTVVAAPNNVFPVPPASEFLNSYPLLSIYHAGFKFSFKLEVLDLCNFLLCLQRRRESREIFFFKSLGSPRHIGQALPGTVFFLAAVIDSHLKSLPMIIKRNYLEFATNIVVTFPLKYVSRLIPVSINIICRYPFSL